MSFTEEGKENMHSGLPAACGNTQFPLTPSKWQLNAAYKFNNELLPLTLGDAHTLEHQTHAQSNSHLWHQERRKRLTASKFSRIAKRRKAINDSFLNSIFYPKPFTNAAIEYGKTHEEAAKKAYSAKRINFHLHSCGLVVNPEFSFLGATPDGKVCTDRGTGILEIKCPFKARELTPQDAATAIKNFCLRKKGDILALDRNHAYFFQVQGQLLVTGAPFCEFVVYTSKGVHIETIEADKEFCNDLLESLSMFYYYHGLPYLFDKYTDEKPTASVTCN